MAGFVVCGLFALLNAVIGAWFGGWPQACVMIKTS